MPNHASITLVGHAGKDAELRTTQGGKSVASFSLAVKNFQGETTWYDCAAWGKTAESYVAPYLKKGDVVFLQGEPKLNEFKKKDGSTGTSIQVSVNQIQICSVKGEKSEPSETTSQPYTKNPAPSRSRVDDMDDDIPPF